MYPGKLLGMITISGQYVVSPIVSPKVGYDRTIGIGPKVK